MPTTTIIHVGNDTSCDWFAISLYNSINHSCKFIFHSVLHHAHAWMPAISFWVAESTECDYYCAVCIVEVFSYSNRAKYGKHYSSFMLADKKLIIIDFVYRFAFKE